MRNIFASFTNLIIISSVVLLTFAFILGISGLRINMTRSIPMGFYWETSEPIQRGAYIIFCPPVSEIFDMAKLRGYIGSGFCEGDYGFMMKRVEAMGGDIISISEIGVQVNGKWIVNSKLQRVDKENRLLPKYKTSHFILKSSEVFLMGETTVSFDSRYFGPINISHIQGVIRPVFSL